MKTRFLLLCAVAATAALPLRISAQAQPQAKAQLQAAGTAAKAKTAPAKASAQAKASAVKAARKKAGPRNLHGKITSVRRSGGNLSMTLRVRKSSVTVVAGSGARFVREERGISAVQLRNGDLVSQIVARGAKARFGIHEASTVVGTNPLTLRVADMATLTAHNSAGWIFNRYTVVSPGAIKVGQSVAIERDVQPNGSAVVKRVAVLVPSPQAQKAQQARKARAAEKSAQRQKARSSEKNTPKAAARPS